MAQGAVQPDRKTLRCSICLDLLKDPVTTSCGHNNCMICIKTYWDGQDQSEIYSCPQCRETFIPRPVLKKNTMLAGLVEQMNKTEQRELQVRGAIQQEIQDREKDVKLLQQQVEAINHSADKIVEHIRRQIRSQQKTEVSRVKELQEKLEHEMTELKRKDAELKQLSLTEDPIQFLHNYPSVSALSESPHSSSFKICPLRYFENLTAAVEELRDKLQEVLRDMWTNIPQTVSQVDALLSEPKSRSELLKYSCEITLDPNTANTWLKLSEENRQATLMMENQFYPDHPDRFTVWWTQVLSRESLTDRCYWEVELRGSGIVAVAYKNIGRVDEKCRFGLNDKSWGLRCYQNRFIFSHNNIDTQIYATSLSRIGVYLDHRAGVLSFYRVSKTMTLLHSVQTTFTQPLQAGVCLYRYGSSVEFCKLRVYH